MSMPSDHGSLPKQASTPAGDVLLTPVAAFRRANALCGMSERTFSRYAATGTIKVAKRLPNGHRRFSARHIDEVAAEFAAKKSPIEVEQ